MNLSKTWENPNKIKLLSGDGKRDDGGRAREATGQEVEERVPNHKHILTLSFLIRCIYLYLPHIAKQIHPKT